MVTRIGTPNEDTLRGFNFGKGNDFLYGYGDDDPCLKVITVMTNFMAIAVLKEFILVLQEMILSMEVVVTISFTAMVLTIFSMVALAMTRWTVV